VTGDGTGFRRNAARVTLLAGALVAVAIVAPQIPTEQRVRLRLDPRTARERRVVHLEIAGTDREPLVAATLLAESGSSELTYTSHLPNGEYVLDIRVDHPELREGSTRSSHRARLELRGEPTTVYLYDLK
jgi:hypothetical protein